MSSLAEELPREINRVRGLKDQLTQLSHLPGVMVGLSVAVMERSITEAINAQGSGDVVRMLHAYEDLKGYES